MGSEVLMYNEFQAESITFWMTNALATSV